MAQVITRAVFAGEVTCAIDRASLAEREFVRARVSRHREHLGVEFFANIEELKGVRNVSYVIKRVTRCLAPQRRRCISWTTQVKDTNGRSIDFVFGMELSQIATRLRHFDVHR